MAGLYARQVKAVGWAGLAGYLLLSLFYALTAPYTFADAVMLPLCATTVPTFVEGFLGIFNGRGLGDHPGRGRMGHPQAVAPSSSPGSSRDIAFFQLHFAKPGMIQRLGNRAMQAYNERWRIRMLLRGRPSLRERPR
jgi:hypothetical protein